MGSPSPAAAAGKLKKECSSSSGSKVGVSTPHRRTSSSVASSCLSEELQDEQSPVRSVNGLGKSPVAATSPRTPASGTSPAALKKRRASIGGADDLARGLDFSSPSTEEKKHSFLTKGGGHKKVATPAKVTTPPSKEKVVVARATGASVLSPRKLGEVKKDSPRKSVLASEGNESGNGEGTTPKKASPKVVAAAKSSPRPTAKPVASTKKSTNGESESPLEVSPVKSLRKSITSLPSLKLKPGLTSPRAQKGVKSRQDTPAQPGRVKRRIEKAVPVEEVEVVSVCSTNGNETEAFDVVTKVDEEGSSLLPSLMEDGDVGDEDMNSFEQGADPGFENDTDMPTSWLSEDLPCMFSSLSSLPEPDDASSSVLGDPLELLDEPEELVSELSNTKDENSVAAEHPRAISKERNPIEPDSTEREQEDELVTNIEQTVMVKPSMVTEKASSSNNEASSQAPSVEPIKVEVPKIEVECDTFIGGNVPYVYISEGALQEERNARPAEEEMLVSSSDDEDLIDGSCSAQLNLKQSFDEAAEADEKEHIVSEECSIGEQKVTVPDAAKFTPTTHLDKDMMIFDFEEYWTHNVGDESSHYDAGQIDADEAKVPTPVEAKSLTPIELPVSSLPEEESMVSQSPKSIPVEESDEDEVFHVYKSSAQSSPKDVRPEELTHEGDFDSRYTTLDTEQCNGVEKPGVLEDKNVENVTNFGQDSSVDALQSVAVDDRETAAQAEDLDAAPRFLAVTSNGLLGANIQDVDENGSEDPPISPVTVPLSSQASPFEALDDESPSMPEVFAKITNDRDDDVKELQSGKSFATPISEVAAEPGVSQDLISKSKFESGDNALVSSEKVASVESSSSMPPLIGINEEEQTEAHFLMSLDNTEKSAHTTNLREEQLLGLVAGDQLISASTEILRVDEAKVPEDEILSAEKPRVLQAHGDEPIETSHGNLSEVDHRPSMSTPESLQDGNYEVSTDKSLQLGISSDPVFDQEDETTKDSKPGVESEELHAKPTVPLEEADVRSTMVVTAAEEITNHTDTAQNLEEGEEIYSTTASPFVVPAEALSKLALNEPGEFDDRSEGTADEEERGGLKEQKIRAEQVLEEEEADSKPSTGVEKDLFSAELVVSEAALVADAKYGTPEDVEIDVEESKEASRNISSPISTPSDIIESHDQEGHIPLGAQIDPISKTEAALETEKVLVPSLDADFDDVEIARDQFSSEDLPLEPCVPSDQKTSRSTADSNETEVSDLTRFKEGENLSENLDTVMDIPQNLFVPSSLDADVDESEEKSALPCKSEETKQETVPQEDDEICSLKTTSLHGTSRAENPETALVNDVENHSSNGDHKEESLSEELSVNSPTDLVAFPSQNSGIRTTWKDESEEAGKVEESSPKRIEVVSGEDTARSIVNEMEEHSSVDARDIVEQSSVDVKEMEEDSFVPESLNGRLTRDEDEDQVVHSPKSQRHLEETPNTSTSSTTHIQDKLRSDDRVEEDVKKESLLEDDDTVMYRPDLKEDVEKVESLPKAVEKGEELPQKAVEELKEISTVSEDTVEYGPTFEESIKVVDSPMEVFSVSQNAAIVDDEEQDDERLNGNVDNTMQHSKDQPTASHLAAADETEKQAEKEVEALPRSQELEVEETLLESSKELSIAPDATKTSTLPLANELEKEESTSQAPSMFEVENPEEPYVTPILLNANTPNSVVSDNLEKAPETLEKSMLEVEESSEEAAVAPELLNAKSAVAAESKPKQTETSDEKSIDQMVVANSKEPLVVPDKDNAVVMTLDGEELDEHPTDKKSLNGIHHEEEPILKAQVDSPSDNLKKDMVLNDAIPSSDGIVVPHDREVEVADAAHLIEVPTPTAAAKDSQAPDVEESFTTVSEKQNNATKLECLQANTNSQADLELDSEPHTPREPQSPTATLYPLLKPPFSGSQQDRLWEEQAEAYNSGQGTPRNASHAGASSPATMVTVLSDSCEDQIQPATNSNGNHAAAAAAAVSSNGAAASHENGNIPNQDLALKERNGKDKLHTPLRSLLLEDAHNNNAITPNGVSSSPSFIRRLFRVMSTSSRSAERDASHAKLKKSSSSMWVSCLGSPQVQP